jgi:hypothetical protein
MPQLFIILYSTIIALFVIACIMGLANWLHLASISSRISLCETELDKKAHQIDLLKKEQHTIQSQPPTVTVTTSDEPLGTDMEQMPSPSGGADSDTIQIVRNVHGVFERTDQLHGIENHDMDGMAEGQQAKIMTEEQTGTEIGDQDSLFHVQSQESAGSAIDVPEYPDDAQTLPQETLTDNPAWAAQGMELVDTPTEGANAPDPITMPQSTETATSPPAASTAEDQQDVDSDVLDVVSEGGPSYAAGRYVIPLYSDASKDADFAAAWRSLTEIMTTTVQPEIAIDFSSVQFLYEKELLYLVKMCQIVTGQQGTIIFINCDHELTPFIKSRPDLASRIAA